MPAHTHPPCRHRRRRRRHSRHTRTTVVVTAGRRVFRSVCFLRRRVFSNVRPIEYDEARTHTHTVQGARIFDRSTLPFFSRPNADRTAFAPRFCARKPRVFPTSHVHAAETSLALLTIKRICIGLRCRASSKCIFHIPLVYGFFENLMFTTKRSTTFEFPRNSLSSNNCAPPATAFSLVGSYDPVHPATLVAHFNYEYFSNVLFRTDKRFFFFI